LKNIAYWISLGTLNDLKNDSCLHNKNQVEKLEIVKSSGFIGVAGINSEIDSKLFQSLGLNYASACVFSNQKEGLQSLKEAANLGVSSITIHLGNGLNSDTEIYNWLEAIFSFSQESKIPVLFETHRNTVFQDIYRTIQLLKKYPKIRLVADFSHWYTGLLLGQGFEEKIKAMDLIFRRTVSIHGRISNDSCIQPALHLVESKYKTHFRTLWQNVLEKSQSNNQEIPIVMELLSHKIGYDSGIVINDKTEDSTDRWKDTLQLKSWIENWYKKNQN
jgi:hypothetical protein